MSYNLVDPTTGDLTRVAGGTLYADVPVGTILSFSGTAIPAGYLLCDGRAVSRADYSNLFTVIGTTFGDGDGSTTFNIPELRGRFIEGSNEANVVGKHIEAGLPNITGSFYSDANSSNASGVFYYKGKGAVNLKNDEIANSGDIHFDASRASTIYGKSNTVQPDSVCVNYVIKAKQVAVPADFMNAVVKTNSYSTIETRIGTWIDGKPIYRKVFTATLQTDEQVLTIEISPQLKSIVSIRGTLTTSINNIDFPIPYCFVDGSDVYQVYMQCQGLNLIIIPRSTSGNYFKAGCNIRAIIEYTKTTD